jgi:hypothetical protein
MRARSGKHASISSFKPYSHVRDVDKAARMETGPGGKQTQLEDPDGNPIELFEPAR